MMQTADHMEMFSILLPAWAFVKEVLARGYYGLLKEEGDLMLHDDSSKLSLRPTTIAVGTANFATAAQLLQSMEQE